MGPSDNFPIQILPAVAAAATQPIQSLTSPEQGQPQTPPAVNDPTKNDQNNIPGPNQRG
jgi:hypothetical protein